MGEIVYYGYPAHFICASKCRFWIVATVNGYCISTIGDMRLDGNRDNLGKDMEEIGCDRFFETMVFPCGGVATCGCCPNITDHGEIDSRGYNTASDAMKGHAEMLAKYAALAKARKE